MSFQLVIADTYWSKSQSYFTLFAFDVNDSCRSLLHIERDMGLWKFQLLWLSNKCWLYG